MFKLVAKISITIFAQHPEHPLPKMKFMFDLYTDFHESKFKNENLYENRKIVT